MQLLEKFTKNIIARDGIFFVKGIEELVSYPKEGNENCFQIEQDSFWFNHRNSCIIEAVKRFAPSEVFFDIGGGNGFVSKGLEDQGIKTVLVEPGIQGCLNAKKRGLENILCSTLRDASFKENSISSIGLFDVLEHIENDREFLSLLRDLQVEGSYVFITVPAYQILWSKEDDEAGHYRRYTIKTMKKVLEESGYKIRYASYIFSLLPLPIFLFRTIPSLLKLNRRSNDINKHKNEHKGRKGIFGKMADKLWDYELNKIRLGKRIHFGGSCLIVAQKNS
jgi:hypothetical protein